MASLKKQSTHGSSDLSYSNCLLGIVHLNITSNSIRLHGSDSKESACSAGDLGFDPWVGKIPWRREWLPTPVLLPGEFQGQRSLAGHSPWGRRESDMTEQMSD